MILPFNWDRRIHIWTLLQSSGQPDARLRSYLSACLGLPPKTLSLHRDKHGKPYLLPPHAWLRFSLSHSKGRAIMVVARDVTPGVDIESLSRKLRVQALAERFFTPAESLALQQCSPATRKASFLQLWCHKEAVLKAHGIGIAFGLQRIDFLWQHTTWKPAIFHPVIGSATDWQVHDLALGLDWVGCIAWRGPPREMILHQGL